MIQIHNSFLAEKKTAKKTRKSVHVNSKTLKNIASFPQSLLIPKKCRSKFFRKTRMNYSDPLWPAIHSPDLLRL